MYPGWQRAPGYYNDESWLSPDPVIPSPRGSPNRSPMYLDDNFNYFQPGSGYIGVPMLPAGFVPLPPSPSMLAASFVPLPPSPRISPRTSPRLGPVPLSPHVLSPYPYVHYPIDPWYLPQGMDNHKMRDTLTIFLTNDHVTFSYDCQNHNHVAGMMYMNPSQYPRSRIHRLLKDDHYIYLDLASPTYTPLTPNGTSRIHNTLIPVHKGYLEQVACAPAVRKLTLTCDAFPRRFADIWRIELDITNLGRHVAVGDVLKVVHEAMQAPVTHQEWSRLTDSEVYEASKAYTKRCRHSEFERMQGVRRVDFLGEKTWFGSISRMKDDDPYNFQLRVRSK